jgi:hypothetical protein
LGIALEEVPAPAEVPLEGQDITVADPAAEGQADPQTDEPTDGAAVPLGGDNPGF